MEARHELLDRAPAPSGLRPAPSWAARYPDPPEEEDPTVTLQHGEDMRAATNMLKVFASEELPSEPVLVAMELAIVYGPNVRKDWLKPDLLVVRGATPYQGENVYALLEEKLPVTLVLELASKATSKNDQTSKKVKYEAMGVREYVLFDPVGNLYAPPFQAYRLNDAGKFVFAARDDRFESELGVAFAAEDGKLVLYNAKTGQRLLDAVEQSEERRLAQRLAFEEARRRHEAELAWHVEADERQEADERAREADERARTEARARQVADERAREADERARTEARARQAADERASAADERARVEMLRRLADKRDAVGRILLARFGPLPSEVELRIRRTEDVALLDRLFDQALTAASLDALAW